MYGYLLTYKVLLLDFVAYFILLLIAIYIFHKRICVLYSFLACSALRSVFAVQRSESFVRTWITWPLLREVDVQRVSACVLSNEYISFVRNWHCRYVRVCFSRSQSLVICEIRDFIKISIFARVVPCFTVYHLSQKSTTFFRVKFLFVFSTLQRAVHGYLMR